MAVGITNQYRLSEFSLAWLDDYYTSTTFCLKGSKKCAKHTIISVLILPSTFYNVAF